MNSRQIVEVRRDCRAVLVPSGQPAVLAQGEDVIIIQQLGDSFTVQTPEGMLARVDGRDADALGRPRPAAAQSGVTGDARIDPERVLEQMRTVYDPEIPINVVDLGLVYRCDTIALDGGLYRVEIDMSMTAPGCGMGDVLRREAQVKVFALPGVAEVDVELVWDPPWDMSRLSEAARLELGMW